MGNKHSHSVEYRTVYKTDPTILKKIKQEQIEKAENLQKHVDDKTIEYNRIHEQLVAIQAQISDEEKLLADFDVEFNDPNAKILVLIGNTGDGKSTVGNRLCGDTSMMCDEGPFEVSDDCKSCTLQISKHRTQIGDVKVTVVDVPGWNDSEGRDRLHANDLCKFLYGCGGINRFILVRNASNYRFDNNLKLMLERYANMFGRLFWNYLTVILTRVEKGFAEQQFNAGNKADGIRNHIYETFNLDQCTIPVIPIGLDNYSGAIQNVVECLPDNKFECEGIRSPLKELKEKEITMIQEDQNVKQELDSLTEKLNKVLNDIGQQLN